VERASRAFKPQSLYELSWTHAQDAKLVLDVGTGLLVDVNPAFETLMGCSRENLIGTDFTGLHPEDERERVRDEVSKLSGKAAVHTGFHILRRDGDPEPVPVQIWSSDKMTFDGRDMLVVEFRDIFRTAASATSDGDPELGVGSLCGGCVGAGPGSFN